MTTTPLALISFDLDNTLWSTRRVISRAERRLRQWLELHHEAAAAGGLSLENFRALRAQVVTETPSIAGQPTQLRLAVLEAGFRQQGYASAEAIDAAAQAFAVFIEARNAVSFFPQAIEVLTELQLHYRLVAITNGNANLKRIGVGHLFAAQYTAEEVGHAKPAPEIYQHMLAEQDIDPTLCLHIGDHPEEDIQAAADCGLHTLWSNVVHHEWPQHLPPPSLAINHLRDIPSLIARHFAPL